MKQITTTAQKLFYAKNITIIVDNIDLQIAKSKDENMTWSICYPDKFNESDYEVIMEQRESEFRFELRSINKNFSGTLTFFIAEIERLSIQNKNGDTLVKDCSVFETEILSKNGNIAIDRCSGKEFALKNSNGDILVRMLDFKSLSAISKNGDVRLVGFGDTYNITTITKNGDIIVKSHESTSSNKSIFLETINGDIDVLPQQ